MVSPKTKSAKKAKRAKPPKEKEAERYVAVAYVNPLKLKKAKWARRAYVDERYLKDLKESIKKHGLIEPIVVRPIGKDLEVVCGWRRTLATRELGMRRIPAVVRSMKDKEAMEAAIVENLQRVNISPIDQAVLFDSLLKQFKYSVDDIADRIDVSPSFIEGRLRLLGLDKEIQDKIDVGFPLSHAELLLAVKDKKLQRELFDRAVKEGWSYDRLRKVVKSKVPPEEVAMEVTPPPSPIASVVSSRATLKASKNLLVHNEMGTALKVDVTKGKDGKIHVRVRERWARETW